MNGSFWWNLLELTKWIRFYYIPQNMERTKKGERKVATMEKSYHLSVNWIEKLFSSNFFLVFHALLLMTRVVSFRLLRILPEKMDCFNFKTMSSYLVAGLPDFSWYMIPKPKKCTQWTQMYQNIPNVRQIFPMALKFINIFQSEALQNLPKLGFLVWK
jgi:hypothetical protein